MANSLPPVPYKTALTNREGFMSSAWSSWFREVFARLGGSVAPSLSEVEADINTLQTAVAATQTRVTVLEGIGVGRQL